MTNPSLSWEFFDWGRAGGIGHFTESGVAPLVAASARRHTADASVRSSALQAVAECRAPFDEMESAGSYDETASFPRIALFSALCTENGPQSK
jgi:hypothetical protein